MKHRVCVFLVFALLIMGQVFACKCLEVSVEDNVASSDIVFKGKILSKVKTTNFDSLNVVIDKSDENFREQQMLFPVTAVSIKTDTIYKGCGSDTITIITPPSSASCGVRFEVGEEYIVYATRGMRNPYKVKCENYNRIFWTHSCTRTGVWYEEEESTIIKVTSIPAACKDKDEE